MRVPVSAVFLAVVFAFMTATACSFGRPGNLDEGPAGAARPAASSAPADQSDDYSESTEQPDDSTVGPVGAVRQPPQPVGTPALFANRLEAVVTSVELLQVEGEGPYETTGPGVLVALDLTNRSDAPIDLTSIAVNATGADGEVGVPSYSHQGRPHHGELPPMDTQSGTYVFRLDGNRMDLIIDVHHAAAVDIVVIQS